MYKSVKYICIVGIGEKKIHFKQINRLIETNENYYAEKYDLLAL